MTLQDHAQQLFDLALSDEQMTQFQQLAELLVDWNTRINLTAITDVAEIEIRHFLDSLSIIPHIQSKKSTTVLDVGTGAGFPGLPLAIMRPEWQVTLMEATAKKLRFIDHVIAELSLTNAKTHHARAEEAGHDDQLREQYDCVTARAVARLPALLEYLLPLTKVGGFCIAMKGSTAKQEVESAGKAIQVLGGALRGIKKIDLPDVEREHFLVIVEKIKSTPTQYPRKPGIPARKPI